jgi:polysaccharide export outer membrane protein
LIDEVEAAGLETMELDRILTDLYSRELKNPVITVIVREFGGQRVYVGGEVDTEGLLSLTSGLTAFEAIVRAGGFLETADPAETLVIRKDAQSRPVPIRVNLSDLINGKQGAVDFRLASDDIVFVPKSAIAEANKFVNQYIERLLLFRGVSFGFSYSINDND